MDYSDNDKYNSWLGVRSLRGLLYNNHLLLGPHYRALHCDFSWTDHIKAGVSAPNGHQQRELAPYSQQFMIWPTAPHRTAQLISTFLNILYRRRWNDSLVCKSIAFPAFQHRTSQSHKQFAWCFSHRCAMWSDAKDEKKHVRTHLYTTCGEKIHIHPVS